MRTPSSTSGLRDELLASYPGVEYLGAPIVLVHRDVPAAAWGWVDTLLRTRSDWWPALGVALQHAARDGGDHARIALADMLETVKEAVVLLEWTRPIAERWPDAKAGLVGTTFGDPDYRLETIVNGQAKLWEAITNAEVSVEGLGPDGSWLSLEVKSAADLEALLAKSAAAGTTRSTDDGPWGWLLSTLSFHHELGSWMPAVANKLGEGSDAGIAALLDWFYGQYDLFRYVALLERWAARPPRWWEQSVDAVPVGWRHPIRRLDSNARTFGQVALDTLDRARKQASTAPILDLERLW